MCQSVRRPMWSFEGERPGKDKGDGRPSPKARGVLGGLPQQVGVKLTLGAWAPAGAPFQPSWWWRRKKATGRTSQTPGAPKWSTPMR